MPDNKRLKGPADRSRVGMGEKYERAYWSKKFGVTGVSLAAAVRKVGNSAEDVKEFFKQKRKTAAKKARAAAKSAGGAKKKKPAKAA
jgi:hypothetical protein